MLLAAVVETSRRITGTSKRLEKTALLADLLRQLRPEEIDIVVAFLAGRTRQGKIGIGYRTLHEAFQQGAETPTLEVLDVDRKLETIAGTAGRGSAQLRSSLLRELFAAATEPEQRFLTGLMTGELRQGALEGIMIDAIAKASSIPLATVRRAAMMAGDIVPVARAAMEKGEAGLHAYDVQLFRPVQPMLAQTAEDIEDALAQLGDASLEYKMDGARVQVHKSGDEVMVFSRGMNDVSPAVPEIVEVVRALPAKELILDGEVISLQPSGRPQPFQITMRRFGRKLDVDRMRAEFPVTPFWFDVLYLDGGHMLDEPQSRRFAELVRLSPEAFVMPHAVAPSSSAADEFVRMALAQGHEGVMAKALGSGYAAGSRGASWLKVKRPRTLDLVILAAEWGNGRRRGWLSNLHLGARDTEKGGFAMLGKTFKGLTDEMLTWQTQELLKLEISRDAYTVYVEPRLVAEIAFNEIQESPRYASGLALRFARVKRYRPDKQASDADTFQTVQTLAMADLGRSS